MPAILEYPPAPVFTAPMPVRRRSQRSLDDLLRRITISVERSADKPRLGHFRPVTQGRLITWQEKVVAGLVIGGLGLAIWLHARPAPLNAHTLYYQSLAMSAAGEGVSAREFVESALRSVGSEWKPAALFAVAHPHFWSGPAGADPNGLAKRMEDGLAQLAMHGSALSAAISQTPALVPESSANGDQVLTCRVDGHLECADGVVLRFSARLIQDGRSKKWGLAALAVPPFLP